MALGRLNEPVFYVCNPCPETTNRQITDAADLELAVTNDEPAFRFVWSYSSGVEKQTLILDPGCRIALRESEVRQLGQQMKEVGIVAVPDTATEAEEKAIFAKGLDIAIKFWKDRGNKRLLTVRKNLGLSKDDMEDYRYEHHCYYTNEAKGEACIAELRRLRKPAPKRAAPKAKEEE